MWPRSSDAQIGFAYDGDGDRVLAVDGAGELHDGDDLIALIARDLQKRGELDGGVAVTVMTNYGFMTAMKAAGIEVMQTRVGDRYVIEALRERDWRLGGEQSGHIVWLEDHVTGDGLAAGLLLCASLGGRTLSQAASVLQRLPQAKENVRVTRKEIPAPVLAEAERLNEVLHGRGRVLVRPSGTEPVVRVLAEAETAEEASSLCGTIARLVRQELG